MSGRKEAPCGTVSGYARHVRRREPIDQACRDAHVEYHRQYRATHPRRLESEAAQHRAKYRALVELAARHEAEYGELYGEKTQQEGPS